MQLKPVRACRLLVDSAAIKGFVDDGWPLNNSDEPAEWRKNEEPLKAFVHITGLVARILRKLVR